jgi:hypothetical protein
MSFLPAGFAADIDAFSTLACAVMPYSPSKVIKITAQIVVALRIIPV